MSSGFSFAARSHILHVTFAVGTVLSADEISIIVDRQLPIPLSFENRGTERYGDTFAFIKFRVMRSSTSLMGIAFCFWHI